MRRALPLMAMLVLGCGATGLGFGPDGAVPPDAGHGGLADGGVQDGGAADGGVQDGGPTDGGAWDGGGGAQDGGAADGGATDGGMPDGGVDGGAPDGGVADGGVAPALFDATLIRDPIQADCHFTEERTVVDDGVVLQVWNVDYLSYESVAGTLDPIRIRGYAARPADRTSSVPGVVLAHGLGGRAEETQATGLSALLGMFVLAYTGPGGGNEPANTSEGRPAGYADGYRMFDTLTDLRGSWFWGHTVAALRGLTCLETRAEIDGERLGITGYSAGGVASLMAAGVDDRIQAAVPVSASGAWNVATLSPDAWQHTLLGNAGLGTASEEWLRFEEALDPVVLVAGARGRVLMVNGSSDEFFPLTAHAATFAAIPGDDRRTALIANFDHGCYLLTGGEPAGDIEARAALRVSGGQRMWFHRWFGTDARYAYLPRTPALRLEAVGQATLVTATVDPGGSNLEVEEVKAWGSNDDAFLFGAVVLDPSGPGVYAKLAAFPLRANTIAFVDVQYRTRDLIFPERFSLSSAPTIPAGVIPHIRHIDTCQ